MFARALKIASSTSLRRCVPSRAYHPPAEKPPSMNDLPIPQGSWQADYDAKQRKYNMHLIAGVAFTVFTLIVTKQSGLVYLNWAPPELKKEE